MTSPRPPSAAPPAKRRDALRQFAAEQLAATKSVNGAPPATTDAAALVAIVSRGVELVSGLTAPARALVEDLQAVLIGDDMEARRSRGPHFVGQFRGASGFRPEFRDPYNQVQHATAGIVIAYRYRLPGELYALWSENEPQDLALYRATFPLGRTLTDKNYQSLPDRLWRVIAERPPELGVPGEKNCHDESYKTETTIDLVVDDRGRLQWTRTKFAPQTSTSGVIGALVTQHESIDRFKTAVDGSPVTITAADGECIYLDCGRWGDDTPPQRNFGLVQDGHAVLCEFVPGAHENHHETVGNNLLDNPPPEIPGSPSLSSVVQAIARDPTNLTGFQVKVLGHLRSHDAPGTDRPPGPVYVFIPDLHLPLTTVAPPPLEIPPLSRSITLPDFPHIPARIGPHDSLPKSLDPATLKNIFTRSWPKHGWYSPGYWWEQRYAETNLFGDGSSASAARGPGPACLDLINFLNRLGTYTGPEKLHIVQLGDMYELWLGLERRYKHEKSGRVVLADAKAAADVDAWMKLATTEFDTLHAAFAKLKLRWPVTYLHGNHDNYLAVHTPPGVQQRVPEVRADGLYAEHGHNHNADSYNQDGATDGFLIAESFFKRDDVHIPHGVVTDKLRIAGGKLYGVEASRGKEPNRRHFHTISAAVQWGQKSDFRVYVMGHTHSPYLTRLRVRVRPDPGRIAHPLQPQY